MGQDRSRWLTWREAEPLLKGKPPRPRYEKAGRPPQFDEGGSRKDDASRLDARLRELERRSAARRSTEDHDNQEEE